MFGRAAADEKGHREPAEKTIANNTRRLRMERMMSKAELARRAGVSTLTIDRVERGMKCRMDTKRKIIEALGLRVSSSGSRALMPSSIAWAAARYCARPSSSSG